MKRRLTRLSLEKLIPAQALREALTELHGTHAAPALPEVIALDDKTLLRFLRAIKKAKRDGLDQTALKYLVKAAALHLVQTQTQTQTQMQTGADKPQPSPSGGMRLSRRKMQQIHDYVQANLRGRAGVDDIARHAGLSRTQLVRRFKATTQKTTHQFVLEVRIREVKALLAGSRLTLAQIAERTGFANASHLSSVFRRLAKTSPSAYRAQVAVSQPSAPRREAPPDGEMAAPGPRANAADEPDGARRQLTLAPSEFGLEQTSLSLHERVRLLKSSRGLGWTDLYAAITDEAPHEGLHGAVPAVWLVTAPTPNRLLRFTQGKRTDLALPEDAISIAPAGEAVYDELANALRPRHFFLRQQIIDEAAEELFSGSQERRYIRLASGMHDAHLRRLLALIEASLDEPPAAARLKVDYLTQALAVSLLMKYSVAGAGRMTPAQAFNTRQVKELTAYINEHLSANIGIDDLAKIVGLGRARFFQRFKATTSMTPHQLITQRRIRLACRLLAIPSMEYALIASACGFASQSHFIAVFKRATGKTPHEYRQLFT
jgi:AraC-like DNA-binding protein